MSAVPEHALSWAVNDLNATNGEGSALRRRRGLQEDDEDPSTALDSPDTPAPHPLTPNISRSTSPFNGLDVAEASRPSLRRLTSEVEKEVAIASAASRSSMDETSTRGSLDLLRSALGKTPGPNEVEVLVHDVKAKDSLMGIALQYGIDVATLRKVNKLWASDSVHLRRHLYVPLEACRWAQATEGFIRGPGEGQITLIPKASLHGSTDGSGLGSGVVSGLGPASQQDEGMGKEVKSHLADSFMPSTNVAYGNLVDLGDDGRPGISRSRSANLGDLVKGLSGLDVSPISVAALSIDIPVTPSPAPRGTVLSVIRIPASELAFFPKAKQAPARKSLDTLSPLRDPLPSLRRSPSSNFTSPLNTLSQAASSSAHPTSKRQFTTTSMTPSTWSASSSKGKARPTDPFRTAGGSTGTSVGPGPTKSTNGPKDRPFEMTARGDGVIALPLDASERALARKREARTSWFSVADDGLDPGRVNGGWG